jgi:hypothetical protein
VDAPNTCDTSSSGGSQCSLRAALEESNATTGYDFIDFDIPGSEVHVIAPAYPLPPILDPVSVNGFSQPGAEANTKRFGSPLSTVLKIRLDGSSLIGVASAFEIQSDASIWGLIIGNFPGYAVSSTGTGAIGLRGNFIGTDGTSALPNLGGVYAGPDTESSAIGSLDPGATGAGNLIAGNLGPAVTMEGPGSLRQNYVGTDRTGFAPMANSEPANPTGAIEISETIDADVTLNIVSGSENGIAARRASVKVSRNRIFGNTHLGLDVGPSGITKNDRRERDGHQNFPVVTSAERTGVDTTVVARLDSRASSKYVVELFKADGETRQGLDWIGVVRIETDQTGEARFREDVRGLEVGEWVTTTATSSGRRRETSEFSKPVRVK